MSFRRSVIAPAAALAGVLLLTGSARAAVAGSPGSARREVLVLGVYHMSNPRADVFNIEADDVLSERRQREIAEVIAVLKRFGPTKIAVEAGFSSGAAMAKRYSEYVAGRHDLSRNETEQLGFRLAKELGHATVYPVDVHGEFPYPRLTKYAKATGRAAEFEALNRRIEEAVRAQSTYLASHTILEGLLYINSDMKVAEAVGFYYQQAEFGEPWDWAGADLLADWFRRNMRIYSNIVHISTAPNDRILVIYGAGHLGWLQQAFASNPNFRLRKLAEFKE